MPGKISLMRRFICCYICVGCLRMYLEHIFCEPNLDDKLIQYYDAYDKHEISHFSLVSIRGINIETFNLINKVKLYSDFLALSINQSTSFFLSGSLKIEDIVTVVHILLACHHLLQAGLEYLYERILIW